MKRAPGGERGEGGGALSVIPSFGVKFRARLWREGGEGGRGR